LRDFTYRGADYFVTVNAFRKQCIFGDPETLALLPLGVIVEEEWLKTPIVRPGVFLDEFMIMPNHLHAIVYVPDFESRPSNPHVRSLGSLIRGFKSAVTSRAGSRVWQRNYYEHVIRNEHDLDRRRKYITENPRRWRDRQRGSYHVESARARAARPYQACISSRRGAQSAPGESTGSSVN
jgi:REP element-mobilizing transposase RayT